MNSDRQSPESDATTRETDDTPDKPKLNQILTEIAELRREVAVLREAVESGALPRKRNRRMGHLNRWQIALDRIKRRLKDAQCDSEWTPPHTLIMDGIALVAIVAVAWMLRSVDLTSIPRGFHGDEAATGLEARRILATGSIGVYTGIAGGNPTGFYYLDALLFRFVDDPVLAVRLLSAIGGTLGTAVLYVLVRRNLGFGSAITASSLFVFSSWHIQFSRLGFVTGIWPTVVLVGAVALLEAVRSKAWYWWAFAGACLAAGTYIYNGNGPLLAIFVAVMLWTLFGWTTVAAAVCVVYATLSPSYYSLALLLIAAVLLLRNRALRDKTALANAASFTIAALIVLKPLIDFIRDKPTDYFGRSRSLSVFRSDAWSEQEGLAAQARFLADRYRDFWDKLTFHPIPDGVDISGVTAVVPRVTLAICAIGLVLALLRRPNTLILLAALIVLTAPLTSVLTDLTLRRALVIAPFLAVLGGTGIVEISRIAYRRGRVPGLVAGIALIALLARNSYVNYTDYFDETIPSGPAQHTLATDLRQTAEFINQLPSDSYLYFYCDRWVLEYDVIRLIAPHAHGENRAPKWGGSGTFEIDYSRGASVFILMGPYTNNLDALQVMYPGGSVVTGQILGPPLNGPTFVAYILPRNSSPA